MKMKKLFLKNAFMALAAMSIVACSNDDEMPAPAPGPDAGLTEVGENASIVLSVGGVEPSTRTRGQGGITNDSDSDNSEVTNLNNMAIFFTDGTGDNAKILKVATVSSKRNDIWSSILQNGTHQATNGGREITDIPAKVKAVYIVGNYTEFEDRQKTGSPGDLGGAAMDSDNINTTDQSTDKSKKNLAVFVKEAFDAAQAGANQKTLRELKERTITSASQQKMEDMTLFGADEDGLKTIDASGATKKFMAEVQLSHLFSRIEVKSISCTDLGNWYDKITMKYIGIVNMNSITSLSGTGSKPYKLGKAPTILEPETASASAGELFAWGDSGHENSNSEFKWSWDKVLFEHFESSGLANANGTAANGKNAELSSEKKSPTFKSEKNYCYMFLPQHIGTGEDPINFNLKLYLEAQDKNQQKGNTSGVSAFSTVTGNFETQFNPDGGTGDDDPDEGDYPTGAIYQVKFEFKEENISNWDPTDPDNIVKLKVTVQPWKIVTDVTPTYE